MVELGSLDSSRKVTHPWKDFANKLHLVLHACICLFVKKFHKNIQTRPVLRSRGSWGLLGSCSYVQITTSGLDARLVCVASCGLRPTCRNPSALSARDAEQRSQQHWCTLGFTLGFLFELGRFRSKTMMVQCKLKLSQSGPASQVGPKTL